MAKGIMYVESLPQLAGSRAGVQHLVRRSSPTRTCWLSTGSSGARRLRPVDEAGPVVAIYELEGDDLQAILDNMIANAGQLHMSDALQLDPAPIPRLLETTTECVG